MSTRRTVRLIVAGLVISAVGLVGASIPSAADEADPRIDAGNPPIDDIDGPDTDIDLGSDETGGEVDVGKTTPVNGSPGRPGNPAWQVLWERFCGYTSNNAPDGDYSYSEGATIQIIWIEQVDSEANRSNYRVRCNRADSSGYEGGTFELPDGSGIGAVDPTILRARAFARVNIEPPGIDSNPSFTDRNAVVNIPTWLWVTDSWDDRIETDADAGLAVQVIAKAAGVRWEFTEPVANNYVNCEDQPISWTPGTPETAANCTYTFTKSSAGVGPRNAFQGTATLTWQFSWTLNGVPQGVFANVDGVSPFDIQVGEIQAVATPNA